MKQFPPIRAASLASLFSVSVLTWVQGAELPELQQRLHEAMAALPEPHTKQNIENLNRFSFSYRLGFDISARFKTVRGFSQMLNFIPETGHVADRNYVTDTRYETYVRIDVNGNEYATDNDPNHNIIATANWGVSGDSFNHVNADGTVQMSAITDRSTGEFETQDSQQTHGLEVIYNRQIGPLGRGTWGLEAAFALDQVGLHDSGTANAYQTRITDLYQLDQRIVPVDPRAISPTHQGQGNVPGPLLQAEPIPGSRARSIETISQAVAGKYLFDADLFGFRLGPYAEFPLGEGFHFSLSGGLALLLVHSQFTYQEDVSLYPSLSSSGKGIDDDLLAGGYVSGRFLYFVSDDVNVFVGGQWQGMRQYRQNVGGKEAQLDIGGRVFFTAGIGFSF